MLRMEYHALVLWRFSFQPTYYYSTKIRVYIFININNYSKGQVNTIWLHWFSSNKRSRNSVIFFDKIFCNSRKQPQKLILSSINFFLCSNIRREIIYDHVKSTRGCGYRNQQSLFSFWLWPLLSRHAFAIFCTQ